MDGMTAIELLNYIEELDDADLDYLIRQATDMRASRNGAQA